MIELLSNFKTISIIGVAKNVGKTTTLNYILHELYGKKRVGITSIGRDGESIDVVTNTPKPKIYVESGTIIATAKSCLKSSDITKEILLTTNINTPLGQIVIVRALSDGFVYLSGPSYNEGIKEVIEIFNQFNVELTLIDGAASRKGLADNYISEATILSTGAAVNFSLEQVVSTTKTIVMMFNLEEVPHSLKQPFKNLMAEANICLIDKDHHVKKLRLKTALTGEKLIIDEISKDTEYLLIKGAITQDLLMTFIMNKDKYEQVTIVVQNGTKCFFNENIFERVEKAGLKIQVLEKTQLLCLTYNPKSPYNYEFDELTFKSQLEKAIQLPILNVMRDRHEKFN